MKKLFLSLIVSLIGALSVGLLAQVNSLPQTSTASEPIWYELTSPMQYQSITVDADGKLVFETSDDRNVAQLFRFEKEGDKYAIINKNGKYLSTEPLAGGKVGLSTTKSLWELGMNIPLGAFSIFAPSGAINSIDLSFMSDTEAEEALWYHKQRGEPLDEPVISDEETTVWYYILNQRGYPNPTNNAIMDMSATAAMADIPLKAGAINAANHGQLWKFVMKDGIKVLQSKNGNYMNGFSSNSTEATVIELSNANGSPGAWQISSAGQVMHVGNNLAVSAWSTGPESYHVIISEGAYWSVALNEKIVAAETLIAASTIGTGVGQFTQAALDNFEVAVNAAKSVVEDQTSTEAQITAAATALLDAQAAFNASVVMPKLSTDDETTWYYIRNTFDKYSVLKRPYACSRESDNRIALTNDVLGDAYLWKFKEGADGKYIIENKLKQGSIQAVNPPTIGDGGANEWQITFRGNGQFTITGEDVEMHADQTGVAVHWNASPIENSASCWTFIQPIVDKDAMMASITLATSLKDKAVVGSKGGQYTQDVVSALEAAIARAQAAYDNESLTLDEFFVESTAITSAIETFKKDVNPAHDIAVASVTDKAYYLKYIGEGVNAGKYLANPRTESTNDLAAEGGRPQARFTAEKDTNTIFKFMPSQGEPKFFTIHSDRGVSGLNGGGDYIDEAGRVRPAAAFDDTKWSWYTLKAEDETLSAGTKVGLFSTFSNKYVVAKADTAIAVMSIDSLPALVFELEEIGPASVENTDESSIRVIAQNGRIEIYGTEVNDFSVYTINGIPVNKESILARGAYFVRIQGKAYKVIVK